MCGIIGVAKVESSDAVYEAYDGLIMLQHRGQDAAGIVSFDGNHFHEKRGKGLVSDVFRQEDMLRLKGSFAIGHCRYPTCGSSDVSETQPFFVNAPLGIYLIHNGNLTKIEEISERVKKTYHRHLRTGSDTEMLLNVFADQVYKTMKDAGITFCESAHEAQGKCSCLQSCVFEATRKTMQEVTGAYAVITLIDKVGMLVFRDPHGIRPLVFGQKKTTRGTEYVFASEDVAFKSQGYERVRDVKPGEAILVTLDGQLISHQCVEGQLNPCIFEYVYLARPDSMIDDISVYKARLRMGTALAKQIKASGIEIDTVMPVPDSGRPVALQIAQDLGIKFREGLIKNRYVGRTFIMPGQEVRQKSIRRKLNPIELEFRRRKVLLVDDSIVRGNTMKKIVDLCRLAGAEKIYVASAAPPVINPDVYGIDMPTRQELIAHGLTIEEIRKLLNIDALFYQKIEDLVEACQIGNPEIKAFHTGVFDGHYPTPEVTEEYLQQVENEGRGKQKQAEEESIASLTI